MRFAAAIVATCLGLGSAACERGHDAPGHGTPPPPESGACIHSACGHDFVVDAVPAGRCRAGQPCSVAVTLEAQGEFHVNDEYPYKFRADDTPGVEFLGTDSAGKNVFSKAALNWAKKGEKTGTMTVSFKPSEQTRAANVVGAFKLSICSQQSCRIEAARVGASVTVEP